MSSVLRTQTEAILNKSVLYRPTAVRHPKAFPGCAAIAQRQDMDLVFMPFFPQTNSNSPQSSRSYNIVITYYNFIF